MSSFVVLPLIQVCDFLLREVNFSLSDLLPLCVLLHSSLSSSAVVSRCIFNAAKVFFSFHILAE